MADEHYARTVGVMRGENSNTLITEVNIRDNVGHIRENGILREHNALSLARSSRGKNEKCESVYVNRSVIERRWIGTILFLTRRNEILESFSVTARKPDRLGITSASDVLFLFGKVAVYEEKFGVRASDGLGEVFLLPVSVEGNYDRANRKKREVSSHPRVRELSYNGTMLTRVTA